MLQFKATVWPKVTPELEEAQKSLEEHPPDPLIVSAFPYCKRRKPGRGYSQTQWAVPWHWLCSGYTPEADAIRMKLAG